MTMLNKKMVFIQFKIIRWWLSSRSASEYSGMHWHQWTITWAVSTTAKIWPEPIIPMSPGGPFSAVLQWGHRDEPMDDGKKTRVFSPCFPWKSSEKPIWVSHRFPGLASPDSKRFGLPVVDIFVHMVQAAAHTHRSPRRHWRQGDGMMGCLCPSKRWCSRFNMGEECQHAQNSLSNNWI